MIKFTLRNLEIVLDDGHMKVFCPDCWGIYVLNDRLLNVADINVKMVHILYKGLIPIPWTGLEKMCL